jgi:hypothetical protein
MDDIRAARPRLEAARMNGLRQFDGDRDIRRRERLAIVALA